MCAMIFQRIFLLGRSSAGNPPGKWLQDAIDADLHKQLQLAVGNDRGKGDGEKDFCILL